ncbi:monodehydroascorbate reductase [Tanacetum coccineum]
MFVNALYQPWRAILSMINMCLTSKTTGYDMPRHPTFLTNRKNLATTARGKKKTAHLLIPSIRFTKLIIHHLRTKHNIHPRTNSPLYYSHEESILNTLKFVRKDERGKDKEGGATKSSDATKVTKPKAAKVTKPAGNKAPKPITTQPPKPKPTPTQPSKAVSEKKKKLVKETPDEPSLAKRSKGGLVGKRRKPKSPLKLVDEPSDEGVPVEEPAHTNEEADLQRALELSLKEQAEQTQGPTRPVVLREPDSEKYQPLPKLALTDNEIESDEEVHMYQYEIKHKVPCWNQNPYTNERKADQTMYCCKSSTHQVIDHADLNRKHMDLEATDASSQQKPEQMDKEFTTTAYPNV